MRRGVLLGGVMLLATALGACRGPKPPEPTRAQPNILVIVADDLGYSDLGSYGSEIATPHLDALAEEGVRGLDFYVAPRGAPTRAMLLTGVDNHVAGFGASRRRLAPNQEGQPGYEGRLSRRVVTVATLLRDAGYHTTMAGKWELGAEPGAVPSDRGFERSFALLDGAASHWSDRVGAVPGRERARYMRDGEELSELAPDHFSSGAYTDFLIESIDATRQDGRPFFAYLAFQAPHGPLAVPEDWRDRYAGRYDEGFDAIRGARLLRMKKGGLVAEEVTPYPGIPTVPAWGDLSDEQKRHMARKMELYAAMVANLDFHVGRLFDYLREIGEYHETLIVFLSDNGTEPGDRGPAGMDLRDREWYARQFPKTELEGWGGPGSFVEYGPAWAQVGMVPFRLFKGTAAEGGVRSPLIVAGPGVKRRGSTTSALIHVSDLTPTFLERAGVEHPAGRGGSGVAPLEGRSLVELLEGGFRARKGPRNWVALELSGDRAIRREEWKAVQMPPPFGTGEWRLFRLDIDPAELYDRSGDEEEEREELVALWKEYAESNGVVLPVAEPPEAEAPEGEAPPSS